MKYNSLRQGLVGAWCPSLGATGYTLLDRSGYGNHGTLTNMDAGTDWVGGAHGTVLDFDGSNDFVEVPNSSYLNFGTNDFSVSGWFYVKTITGHYSSFFSENNPGPNNSQFWFRQETVSGAVRFATEDNTGFTATQTAAGAIVINQWIHFAVRRANTELAIFKNGAMLSSTTNSIRNVSSQQSFVIAKQSISYLLGLADDIKAYNRALTYAEIRLLASEPGIGLKPERTSVYFGESLSSRRRKILTGLT
jgi:hypothetical protein